jgi:hypothetical protein
MISWWRVYFGRPVFVGGCTCAFPVGKLILIDSPSRENVSASYRESMVIVMRLVSLGLHQGSKRFSGLE